MNDKYIKQITNLSTMKALTAVIHKEDGVYVAKCPNSKPLKKLIAVVKKEGISR